MSLVSLAPAAGDCQAAVSRRHCQDSVMSSADSWPCHLQEFGSAPRHCQVTEFPSSSNKRCRQWQHQLLEVESDAVCQFQVNCFLQLVFPFFPSFLSCVRISTLSPGGPVSTCSWLSADHVCYGQKLLGIIIQVIANNKYSYCRIPHFTCLRPTFRWKTVWWEPKQYFFSLNFYDYVCTFLDNP